MGTENPILRMENEVAGQRREGMGETQFKARGSAKSLEAMPDFWIVAQPVANDPRAGDPPLRRNKLHLRIHTAGIVSYELRIMKKKPAEWGDFHKLQGREICQYNNIEYGARGTRLGMALS
jgi:hypothetical protein